jgi:hypothetical protein
LSISEGIVRFPLLVPAGAWTGRGSVSSSAGLGLSRLELSALPLSTHRVTIVRCSPQHGAFPLSPDFCPWPRRCSRHRSAALCADGVPEYHTPFRLLAALRVELRCRFYPRLPLAGSRVMFAFSGARPFVRGCRTLSPIPLLWTLPGLLRSRLSLPHRVARTHRGALGRNPQAFVSIVQTRPFPSLGRPVPPWAGARRLRPGGAPQTLQTPPRGGRPVLHRVAAGGCRSVLAVSRFRVRARVDFSIPSSSCGQ